MVSSYISFCQENRTRTHKKFSKDKPLFMAKFKQLYQAKEAVYRIGDMKMFNHAKNTRKSE